MSTFGLLISNIVSLILLIYILKQKNKNQLQKFFLITVTLVFFWNFGIFLQNQLSSKYNINPYVFECFVYIFTCFLPVSLFFTSLVFANTKIKFRKRYLLLFVIPIISLIVLWTNNYHHLFYEKYSIHLNDTVTGPYTIIHFVYTYGLFAISIINLLRYSTKNAGFFSKQSILIVIGVLIPIIINILGTFNIIPMTVYVTPICFAFSIFFFALAIFKFGFLKVTPIAMQRVVDRMSDSFLVINDDNTITDFNNTFLKTFDLNPENVRNINFIDFVISQNLEKIDINFLNSTLEECKSTEATILVRREMQIQNKYFNIEASGIFSNNVFLGTLILLKDVTQHINDLKTIQSNQNMLMERERLASLGQLIGGIAHNLKTPIMSISGAAEGLSDLIKEYELSVGDPEVTVDDHHAIAKDMTDWIEKIRSYTEYMSDVITAVKGQAVTMSEEQAVSFTLDELVKRVNILMRHELKNALTTLNIQMKAEPDTILKGNINSLVQVINNMISNAIQVYNGEPNKDINLILEQSGKNIIISVQDFGNGLPEEVQEKLFKEMITTKGKNGTGLGLFMSYSTIRAHFNGSITFETAKGKGTIFHIILPM